MEAFKVVTLFDCYQVDKVETIHQFDPMWRQNVLSCRVLLILQQMYNFNITFVLPECGTLKRMSRELNTSVHVNNTADIYLKLMAITIESLNTVNPIDAIFVWRFGFILRRESNPMMAPYYSLPFAKSVWLCILGIILLVTVIFYVVRRWEKDIVGHLECSFIYEFYIAFGVYCQHSLPSPSIFWSHRIAYFFFVIFAYITNSFYTSNLLSFIVIEKEGDMDLKALAESDYNLKILENMKLATERRVNSVNIAMNEMARKLTRTKSINLSAGLEAVRTEKTALLCDYPTVYSAIARTFNDVEICELEEVDIFSNVKLYLSVGKQFQYTEQFKMGILRMKEAGIIKKLMSVDPLTPLTCVRNRFFVSSYSEHIVTPLLIICIFYFIAFLIMIAEILHNRTHKTWPYIN